MNLKVCLTGSFPENREVFKKRLIGVGYHVVGSVTPQLDYLVVGENVGSKVDKAKDLGIICINYQTMCETANITPCVYPVPPTTDNCPGPTTVVEDTLKKRGNNYGSFQDGAVTMQRLKDVVASNKGYERLSLPQREAISMILHKVGRIVNGNPNHIDSWHDIAGYAQLIENSLTGEGEQ